MTSTASESGFEFAPGLAGALSGLELKARRIVDGYLAGAHRGPRRGSSAEFAAHREYTPGDDLRYLDWKVYGKRDRFYVRQLEEETNFVCQILLDVSDSMRYRSEGVAASKLECARLAAAALAYLVLRQQDAVGLTTFAAGIETRVAPSGHPSHLKQIVHALESISTELPVHRGAHEHDHRLAAASPADALHELAEQFTRRCVIVVLSDCFGDPLLLSAALRHFRSRRHDVMLLQVIDPAEQDFPFEEPTRFLDIESPQTELIDPKVVRAAYCREFEAFRRRLEAECRDLGMDYGLLRTDQPLDAVLAAFLARRMRKGA